MYKRQVLSRTLSGIAAITFRNAKTGGLLATFSQAADKRRVCYSLLVWFACYGLWVLCLSFVAGLVQLCFAGLIFWYYYRLSYRQFGGITGDLRCV